MFVVIHRLAWHDFRTENVYLKVRRMRGSKMVFLTRRFLQMTRGMHIFILVVEMTKKKYVQTGRVCKLKFEKGTGIVSPDGIPKTLNTFCFF